LAPESALCVRSQAKDS
jgi:hypothetical protein